MRTGSSPSTVHRWGIGPGWTTQSPGPSSTWGRPANSRRSRPSRRWRTTSPGCSNQTSRSSARVVTYSYTSRCRMSSLRRTRPTAEFGRSLDGTRRPCPARMTLTSSSRWTGRRAAGSVSSTSASRYSVEMDGVDRPRSTALMKGWLTPHCSASSRIDSRAWVRALWIAWPTPDRMRSTSVSLSAAVIPRPPPPAPTPRCPPRRGTPRSSSARACVGAGDPRGSWPGSWTVAAT